MKKLLTFLLLTSSISFAADPIISQTQAWEIKKFFDSRPAWVSEATAFDILSGKLDTARDTVYKADYDLFPIPTVHGEITIQKAVLSEVDYSWTKASTIETVSRDPDYIVFFILIVIGILTAGIVLWGLQKEHLENKILYTFGLGAAIVFVVMIVYGIFAIFYQTPTVDPWEYYSSVLPAIAYCFLQPGVVGSILVLFFHGIQWFWEKFMDIISVVDTEIDEEPPVA